jgi:hypothetical protein
MKRPNVSKANSNCAASARTHGGALHSLRCSHHRAAQGRPSGVQRTGRQRGAPRQRCRSQPASCWWLTVMRRVVASRARRPTASSWHGAGRWACSGAGPHPRPRARRQRHQRRHQTRRAASPARPPAAPRARPAGRRRPRLCAPPEPLPPARSGALSGEVCRVCGLAARARALGRARLRAEQEALLGVRRRAGRRRSAALPSCVCVVLTKLSPLTLPCTRPCRIAPTDNTRVPQAAPGGKRGAPRGARPRARRRRTASRRPH